MAHEIVDELLAALSNMAKERVSAGELRATGFAQEVDEWWEQNTEAAIKRVEEGRPDGFVDLMVADFSPQGIVFACRQVRKARLASQLECSAVAWGIKESGLRKGVKNRLIQNEYL